METAAANALQSLEKTPYLGVNMDIKTPTLADTIVSNKGRYYGAADRDRTGTLFRARDFKSLVSACSTTAANTGILTQISSAVKGFPLSMACVSAGLFCQFFRQAKELRRNFFPFFCQHPVINRISKAQQYDAHDSDNDPHRHCNTP